MDAMCVLPQLKTNLYHIRTPDLSWLGSKCDFVFTYWNKNVTSIKNKNNNKDDYTDHTG